MGKKVLPGWDGRSRWWSWIVALLLAPAVVHAELIYDNSVNNRSVFLSLIEEFGDEIDFAGSARTVTSMTFSVFGETNLPPTATVQLRVYKNDGPPLASAPFPIPTPGELLYESADIPVVPGVQPIEIRDVAVPMPTTVTWTVEFKGAGIQVGDRAGLEVYFPPIVGTSFRDYWARGSDGFELRTFEGLAPASFAARFVAEPDPPVVLTAEPAPEGTYVKVSGPIGSDQIIESSPDMTTWRTLTFVSLATTSSGTYLDASAPRGTVRYYRARPSPTPGSTFVIRDIRPGAPGTNTLTFVGPRASAFILQSSSDYQLWQAIDVVHLLNGAGSYDVPASSTGQLIYRTSHPTGRGPVYLLRGIRRQNDGSVVLSCSGMPSTALVTVEATTNLVNWSAIGAFRFISTHAEFHDPGAASRPNRSYRLRN